MPATVIQPSRRTTRLGRVPSQPARPACTPNAKSTAPWGHSGTRRLRNISPSSGHTSQTRNELTAIVTTATTNGSGTQRTGGRCRGAQVLPGGVHQGEDEQRGGEPHHGELGGAEVVAEPVRFVPDVAQVVGERLDEGDEHKDRHT